jgi:hypothetical protein
MFMRCASQYMKLSDNIIFTPCNKQITLEVKGALAFH